MISYRIIGNAMMAAAAEARRADGLWKHTCFELFVWPEGGSEYFEFNFAPSTEWAAYRLSAYRADLEALPIAAPGIERLEDGVRVTVDLSGLSEGAWRVGISAVIEEPDGTISYWALAHPDGKADFHDPACFALTI
ncbi:MAG: DOMON-like domain-containing protein [Sphingomonadales bacterium]|nr:MAG: DOMON-like domain-containing protein [Sphingomonadales bacterium]